MRHPSTLLLLGGLALGACLLVSVAVRTPPRGRGVGPAATGHPLVGVNEAYEPPPRAPWADELERFIERRMAPWPEGDIGVYAYDLERGEGLGYRDEVPRYLASGVKLLFMVELYRQREAGLLSFDERLYYGWDDVRDGAPAMNRLPRGESYPISELLLYMLRDSDNCAADLLVGRIGTRAVQSGLIRDGFPDVGPVVPLMDVRREVYRRLDPRADQLTAVQVRDVRWRDGFHPRLDLLKKHIGPPHGEYGERELDLAYDDYYALGRNHVPMRTVGALLARLWRRQLVSERASGEMLQRLGDVWSSGHRIRGAIPEDHPVLHKTGTQHERTVDLAIVVLGDGRPLILTLAVEGIERLDAEPILAAVARRAFDLAEAQPRVPLALADLEDGLRSN